VGGWEVEVPRIELPTLADGELQLRPATLDDVPSITAVCRDPAIQRWTRVRSPYTAADARDYVEQLVRPSLERGTGVHLLVVPTGTAGGPGGTVLGAVGCSVDRSDLAGIVGYWLAPEARGRGVATRGTRLVCRFAFDELGLGYLGLNAAVDNAASNAVARRLGFTLEGTMRAAMVDGPSGDPTAPRADANWWGLRPGELT
jgi:RimJ/RimL family protein N-acetyltransferase